MPNPGADASAKAQISKKSLIDLPPELLEIILSQLLDLCVPVSNGYIASKNARRVNYANFALVCRKLYETARHFRRSSSQFCTYVDFMLIEFSTLVTQTETLRPVALHVTNDPIAIGGQPSEPMRALLQSQYIEYSLLFAVIYITTDSIELAYILLFLIHPQIELIDIERIYTNACKYNQVKDFPDYNREVAANLRHTCNLFMYANQEQQPTPKDIAACINNLEKIWVEQIILQCHPTHPSHILWFPYKVRMLLAKLSKLLASKQPVRSWFEQFITEFQRPNVQEALQTQVKTLQEQFEGANLKFDSLQLKETAETRRFAQTYEFIGVIIVVSLVIGAAIRTGHPDGIALWVISILTAIILAVLYVALYKRYFSIGSSANIQHLTSILTVDNDSTASNPQAEPPTRVEAAPDPVPEEDTPLLQGNE